MAWMKWDEKKDGCHWRFKGKSMGLYLRLKCLRKIVSLWGYVSGLGGLMGAPRVQMVDLRPHGMDEVG